VLGGRRPTKRGKDHEARARRLEPLAAAERSFPPPSRVSHPDVRGIAARTRVGEARHIVGATKIEPVAATVQIGLRCDECGGEGRIPVGRGRQRRARTCTVCVGTGELREMLSLPAFRELAGRAAVPPNDAFGERVAGERLLALANEAFG
jgi:hypothetical protein